MRSRRALVTLTLSLLLAAPARAAPKLELELGAGASGLTAPNPTFLGRIGLDLANWFTPSVRVMSVTPLSGHAMGWSVLAELRAHSSGHVQFMGGLGIGLATAAFVTRPSGGLDAQVNSISPYLYADLGVRFTFGPFWVGLSAGGAPLAQQWLGLLTVGFCAFGG
jgi:hypothetical protein